MYEKKYIIRRSGDNCGRTYLRLFFFFFGRHYLGTDVRGVGAGDEFSQKAVQLGAFDVSVTCEQNRKINMKTGRKKEKHF